MSTEVASSLIATTSLRVRYAETDVMGVVYYANYLVWFEIGRTDWLRQTGQSYRDMEDRKSTRLNSSHSQQSRMPSSA